VLVLGDGFREAIQEGLHCRRIGVGHHQRKGIIRARLHGSKDVGKGEALVAKPWRAASPLPPDMADAAFLANARLVLEKQPEALVFMPYTDVLQERRSPF